jgi:hypothetical protein
MRGAKMRVCLPDRHDRKEIAQLVRDIRELAKWTRLIADKMNLKLPESDRMTFLDDIEDDLDDVFFTDFAKTGTYSGAAIDYIDDDITEQSTSIPGFVLPVKTILVKKSDVTQPKAGDVFIDSDGVSFRVGAGSRQDGDGVWSVPLSQKVLKYSSMKLSLTMS